MTHGESWAAHATLYVFHFGLSVIPISQEKKPLVKWTEFQSRRPSMAELLDWPKENLAIVTGSISDLVIVDCESREDAEWFWKKRGQSPVVVQTSRGYHLYFRHPGQHVSTGSRFKDKQGRIRYDVRGDGGYALAPPSKYRTWIKPLIETAKLPKFQMSWRPAPICSNKDIRDGAKYIEHIRAVGGQGGSNDTFRAARILRESGIGEAEALFTMQQWNKTNASPPWSEGELLHKVKSAYRK